MNDVLAALVQTTFARSANDPDHSRVLLEAVVAAIEGDPAPLRAVITAEQAYTIEELNRIQALQIPTE